MKLKKNPLRMMVIRNPTYLIIPITGIAAVITNSIVALNKSEFSIEKVANVLGMMAGLWAIGFWIVLFLEEYDSDDV